MSANTIAHYLHPLASALATPSGKAYAGVVMAGVLLLYALRRHMFIFSLAALPGTLLHELLHFIAGLASLGRPTGFSVIPRRVAHGYILGSVRFAQVRWYNAWCIGLAPLLLLPMALFLLVWRVQGLHGFSPAELLWTYLLATLIYASLPSWPDIKIAASSFWLLAFIAAVYWIVTSEGFRIAKLQ